MEWQTEKLSGYLEITADGHLIHSSEFTLPAEAAVGKITRRNILDAAGMSRSGVRCVRHRETWLIVNARVTPREHLFFVRRDLPDIQYRIMLYPADPEIRFCQRGDNEFWPVLGKLQSASVKSLILDSCQNPARRVDVADAVVELRHLTLKSCRHVACGTLFPAIGRLKQLRGLDIDQLERRERIVFDRAAVTELGKLENFEVLALRNGITITDDALREIGTLKNLKALYLNLSSHEFANKSACIAALSFLKKLDKLEYLNITTRHPHSRDRLTLRALEFPPNLKYLVLEGRVYHPNTTRFEKDKREKANGSETPAAILLKYGLPKFDNTRNSFVIGFKSPPLHTATVKPLVKLFVEDGALVCRFKGKEVFRIAGDGAIPEDRQQLVTALREMLLKLPPDDGAKIVKHGIAVDFDAPELAKLIETELAIKVIPKK